ncbi:AAA family ATPase [Undibacterium luofuense]|uniref:ATP-dependent Clp protease ATP-binding subunit n=1 Tax=Undibacterium luofuense TaxID=2828733 RepID=A0A941I6F6_9BURK|nr:AAA family ATPase [Undibacterium luofuense]MBR7783837.1 ATP-dependent Clp protease ATP-binding subunit [Undibacterium luofuense]
MTSTSPRWLQDVQRLLPIRSQFVLSGNIRDSFISPVGTGNALVPLTRCLWESVRQQGFQFLLIFDPADGLRVYPDEPAARDLATRLFDLKLCDGLQMISLESLSKLMRKLSQEREARCALVVDFASRLARQHEQLTEAEHRFFVAAEKISLQASPLVPQNTVGKPVYNPVIWLLNRAQDLPSWFTLDSERVASVVIARPDFETRRAAAGLLAPLFNGFASATPAAREQFLRSFTEGTEGMSLTALSDITELADRQQLDVTTIDDAVRCYKVGALDNPWRKDYLRDKIRSAQGFIEERVKGQKPAVVKTLDILKRSAMGLTGAHARSGANRPRGVLFFAGPTGVGKTELAKTLTQLVFGDERAYLRFDMSEFAEEHTSARLLGAPPGYVGFDAGGELTNAVRQKPFSVVLFDEIEKAHPRILDKFLQILEDGRLTDGRGDTAYFSETILVFTSNLGIFTEDQYGHRQQNVQPGDPYETVETKVRNAISDYFKFRLSRPELLNRIGDNIVVFNFIQAEVATQIFDGMLRNVARRLHEELRLQLSMPQTVRDELLLRCTRDLSNGGRGIGNALESCLINPLSRALFETDLENKQKLIITGIQEQDKVISLSVQAT